MRVVTGPDPTTVLDDQPLVLHGAQLYTQRQWVDECAVASALRSLAGGPTAAALSDDAQDLLVALLPPTEDGEPNLQHVAARSALGSRLTVVVGGPGTGKTHTIARLLAVLLANDAQSDAPMRIALAAPTGKAAARLREAIVTAASATLDGVPVLAPAISAQLTNLTATTLHRLLGSRGVSRTRFAHDADHRLPYDIIVVDETSMVALPLMSRLLEAIHPTARLVLVGDPDQLESIDVGAVLSDIADAAASPDSPLHTHVVRLRRPRRQHSGSPIAALADAIRENRPTDVVALLRGGNDTSVAAATAPIEPELTFIESERGLSPTQAGAIRAVLMPPLEQARDAALQGGAADALRLLAGIRVLCAHRRGPYGAEYWNQSIEQWVLDDAAHPRDYPGRALLVTHNDARTRLSNGDTGVIVAHPDGVRAAFRIGDEVHEFAPSQLDGVETAFAMTIHKSQGSEYATVIVVLPPASSPLIGRELLYTAVTRASRRLIVVGSAEAVEAAVCTPGRRVTGLTAALS